MPAARTRTRISFSPMEGMGICCSSKGLPASIMRTAFIIYLTLDVTPALPAWSKTTPVLVAVPRSLYLGDLPSKSSVVGFRHCTSQPPRNEESRAQPAMTRISSGVVRQHPPIKRAPALCHSLACSPKESRIGSPLQSFFVASYVSPELGYTRMGLFVNFLAARINAEI